MMRIALGCAERLPEPERSQFLALINEARAKSHEAWALYHRVSGIAPRVKSKRSSTEPA